MMLSILWSAVLLILSFASGVRGQEPAQSRPMPRVLTPLDDPFYPLVPPDLPAPSTYRDASGNPGPRYWQQRADYDIIAVLDTAAGTIEGRVTIRYTNNSPHELQFVWLQLDQNFFRPESAGGVVQGGRVELHDTAPYGMDLRDVTVDGRAVVPEVHGTTARLDLAAAIPPNGSVSTLTMHFRYVVPSGSKRRRMGRDSTLFMLAQWYPRIAVYDDVRGWNTEQYLGEGEFYLEFGDFTYAITVPDGYVVAATGTLQNPGEVLTALQRERLALAVRDTGVIRVITADEARASAAPLGRKKTWRFAAKNVRDVAWAAAPDFRWDVTSWSGILCHALYPVRAPAEWDGAAANTCGSIRRYSELIGLYPYPQITTVAGLHAGGMEYPMITFNSYDAGRFFGVIDHEVGHQWFPMIVGSNERRYGWMDEGFNTYLNSFSFARREIELGRPPRFPRGTALLRQERETVMTRPDHRGFLGYSKPAEALFVLRNQVVGRAAFDRALRTYYERWAFKHPTPADFFRTIENVTGQDLSWFWRAFFYSNELLDIGIDTVYTQAPPENATASRPVSTVIQLRRHTSVPFPVTLRARFADGSTEDFRLPVDVLATPTYTLTIVAPTEVVGVRLWPNPAVQRSYDGSTILSVIGNVPDANPRNDVYGHEVPAATPQSELPTACGASPHGCGAGEPEHVSRSPEPPAEGHRE